MILHIIRAVFVLAVLAIAISYATQAEFLQAQEHGVQGEVKGLAPTTKVTLVLLVPTLVALGIILLDMGIRRKSLGGISGLFFGVVAGTVLAYILGIVVELIAAVFIPAQIQAEPEASAPTAAAAPSETPSTGPGVVRARGQELARQQAARASRRSALVAMIKLLVGAVTIYLCVSFVMQTKDDFRFIIPYVEFARQAKGLHPMLLDTSVIIDGRIADIADTRILKSPLIVPRFVLEEIQTLADSSDKLKRNRGRRGLDVLNRLQGNDKVEIRLMDVRLAEVEELSDVDHKLVALAKHMDGQIVTNDYNLNKVAQLRGVEVININDLANAIKPVVLAGETLTVKIIKPGEEPGQGVGYLDDGTMVVAEQGRERLGQEMTIVVTSTLQTSAGRMIFGRPGGSEPGPNGPTRPTRKA